MDDIKYLYQEMLSIARCNRGFITMMLDRNTGDVWNDFFVDQNSFKIYASESIVAIPIDDITYNLCDHISTQDEIVQAIQKWVFDQVGSWNK